MLLQVAIRPHRSNDLILGVVLQYYPDRGEYDAADVDDRSTKYTISSKDVFPLDIPQTLSQRKLSKGDPIYAIYPDTTSFYKATVAAAPRKGSLMTDHPTILVQFDGDEDESGKANNIYLSIYVTIIIIACPRIEYVSLIDVYVHI